MERPTWSTVLDDLEALLELQRHAIEHDPASIVAFDAPEELGPLPAGERARAITVLGAMRRLESRAATLVASTAREREVVRSMMPTGMGRTPVFVDRRI